MKKVFFLMSALLLISAASVKSQVTMGSLNEPHKAAVLDLDATTKGLLLPNVFLTDVSIFAPLQTDISSDGEGMLVYNTNPAVAGGTGVGLYVWDGERWNPVKGSTVAADPQSFDLPAPDVSPMSGSFCGAVNFTISNPGGWTSSEWESLTAANIEATCAGMPVTGAFSTDGTNYYYSVPATDAADQVVTLNFTGDVASKPIIAMGSPASVSVRTTYESDISLTGKTCFDIANVVDGGSCSDLALRKTSGIADFNVSYPYTLAGSLGAGVTLESVAWSYDVNYNGKPASNAIVDFNKSSFSTTLANNKVDVSFNPALLNDLLDDDGITVMITATVTTSSAACGSAVYTLTREVNIRDCFCCGCDGVAMPAQIGDSIYLTHEYETEGVMRCWMVENLKEIPSGTVEKDPAGSGSSIVPQYWTTYNNGANSGRGYYYNWLAAQNACPAGWSLPTQTQLVGANVTGDEGIFTTLSNPATVGRGFWYNATVLAGYRSTNGAWNSNWGTSGAWWCRTSGNTLFADSNDTFNRYTTSSTALGISVRCIKKETND